MAPRESPRPARRHQHHHHGEPEERRQRRKKQKTQTSPRHRAEASAGGGSPSEPSSQSLSFDALARLDQENARRSQAAELAERREKRRASRVDREREHRTQRAHRDDYREVDRDDYEKPRRSNRDRKKRVVSGAIVEEGRSRGRKHLRGGAGGTSSYDSLEKEPYYAAPPKKNKRRLWILIGCAVVIIIVIIVVAVVVSKNKSSGGGGGGGGGGSSSSTPSGINASSVPAGAPSWLDPLQWVDTTDFNLTYTDVMVGDLPIMGLNSTWDDSNAPNDQVPALDQPWGSYAAQPARGVSLGGWLSVEPFITPSLFNYDLSMGVIDEWTLCTQLGASCNSTLEQHYATFVTEQTFQDIADAGLDHIRIPYSYWAVEVYPGDPYLFRTSWRYLLRGIEWARKYGLRVNLDLHGLPGSQNGWNHSGHQGPIGWFNGTDGELNAQRSMDIHDRLSQFFAQDRYKNIITHYGLANEPRMTFLSVPDVLNWTTSGYDLVRGNGIEAIVVFGDGFMGLENWQGLMTGYANMTLDAHQYVIFNTNQIDFNHTEKIQYACTGWTQQTEQSMDTATGYGPTIVAEWSQADTDCAQFLNNVGWGDRWTGTYDTGNASTNVLTPRCPLFNSQCECDDADADATQYSDAYKAWLLAFAEAQMYSFEKGWGWWYWTWDTESATQWSYKKALAAGIMPQKAYSRSFNCDLDNIPSFSGLAEYY